LVGLFFIHMKVELKNFHVLVADHDLFENDKYHNFHVVFFDPNEHKINWEYFLAELHLSRGSMDLEKICNNL